MATSSIVEQEVIYTGTVGLDNSVDAFRLPVSESKVRPLSACKNVRVDNSGRVFRRDGYTATAREEVWSNLFAYKDVCLGVYNGNLCRIRPDLSYAVLSDVSGTDLGFTVAGGRVWYSDGANSGVIDSNLVSWPEESRLGPRHDEDLISELKGNILEYSNGRIYAATDNYVMYSDRFKPGVTGPAFSHFLMPDDVTVMAPDDSDGLWVSDEFAIWYINKAGSRGQIASSKAMRSAVRGTKAPVDLHLLNMQELQFDGVGSLVLTAGGISLLGPSGVFKNLTGTRVEFRDPDNNWIRFDKGYGLIRRGQYLTAASGVGLSMNLLNKAVGQQTGLNFNSACVFENMHLVASDDGIFTLGGDTDAGAAISSMIEFGVPFAFPCRMRAMYIKGEFAGVMKLTAISNGSDRTGKSQKTVVYYIDPRHTDMQQQLLKVPMQRANGKSADWLFTLENVNGADFSIDQISVIPIYCAM